MVENIKDDEKYIYFSNGRYAEREIFEKACIEYKKDLRYDKDASEDLINIMSDIIGDAPVDLKLAKELKELGFNKKTNFYYVDNNELPHIKAGLFSMKNNKTLNHNKYDDFIYSAPTNKVAQEWLTKNKKPQIS